MKKKIVLMIMMAMVIAGCGKADKKDVSVSTDTSSGSQVSQSTVVDNPTSAVSSAEASINVAVDSTTATPTSEVSGNHDEDLPSVIELNEEEMAYFTEFIQASENYGFLLSEYDESTEMELEPIFYNNAGYEMEHLDEAQMAEYLDYLGEESIGVGCYKLPMSHINEILSLRTGHTYEDMKDSFDYRTWYYDEASDSYFHFCGDVNYETYVVEYGFRTADNHVVLRVYQNDFADPEKNGYLIPRKQVVLTVNEGEYLFESCNYIRDYNAICDYCYKVCEPNVGTVEIYAYSPLYPNHDYTLTMYCSQKAPITLNSGTADNILTNVTFDHIDSISLRDYNSDAAVDMAVVAVYKFNDKDEYIKDVKIYDWYFGSFCYSEELTNEYKNRTPDWNEITANKALDFCATQAMFTGEWKEAAISQLSKVNENVSVDFGGYYFFNFNYEPMPGILAVSGVDYIDEVAVTTDGTEVYYSLFPGSNFEVDSGRSLIKVSFDSSEIHKDTIYSYANGAFSLMHEGSYVTLESDADQYEEILWDNEPVSMSEYNAVLEEVGNFVSYEWCELMSYDQVVRTIEGTYEPIFD